MSDLNWAEQAEAILKRRRSIIKEFAKLTGEARVIAEANAEESFKREMRGAVGPWPQTAFINTTTPYYGTTMSA